MVAEYTVANAPEMWAKAQAEIEKRNRLKVQKALGDVLTRATEAERGDVGDSFRGSIEAGAPSGFKPADIPDPLVTVIARQTRKGSAATARMRQNRGHHDFRRWNRGILQHPLFGDRSRWMQTTVGAWKGVWQKAVKPIGPDIKRVVAREMDRWFQRPGR